MHHARFWISRHVCLFASLASRSDLDSLRFKTQLGMHTNKHEGKGLEAIARGLLVCSGKSGRVSEVVMARKVNKRACQDCVGV